MTTIHTDSIRFFAKEAAAWWNPKGPMGALHAINKARLSFIKREVCQHFGRNPDTPKPYEGLKCLDVGSGAGLTAEPLCRLGAHITGLEASHEVWEAAVTHAELGGLDIDYYNTPIETFEETGFDIILALEVIEHTADPALFLKEVCAKLAPHGLLFVSTLNRTLLSYVFGILVAERLLKWVPKGAHDWQQFLKPSEIAAHLKDHKIETIALQGFSYAPLSQEWRLSDNLEVNYIMAATPSALYNTLS